jgi:hypothetical protein
MAFITRVMTVLFVVFIMGIPATMGAKDMADDVNKNKKTCA